ncbi:MAG: hypothetical protein JWP20_38 [Roseomonas sp.]|nr:hypothetical protein [Roseomonas sp.]
MRFAPFTGMTGLLALLALAGCDDTTSEAAAARDAQAAMASAARDAAQAKLRADLRGDLTFQDVRVFPQATAGTVAVCGQVGAAGAAGPVPFVSLVSRQPDGALAVEQHVATENVSATRVYVETSTRCVADAASDTAPRRGAPPPLPPVPSNLAVLAPAASPQVARIEAEAQAVATVGLGAITMRQPGNLRQHPNAGGAVLRVVPRGNTLRVFAEAPGGWLRVGAQEAEGWMHSSLASPGPAGQEAVRQARLAQTRPAPDETRQDASSQAASSQAASSQGMAGMTTAAR